MQHRKAFPAMALALGATLAAATMLAPGRAGAVVIYDNGGPSALNVVSDQDDLGNVPGVDLPIILSDDFSLDVDSELQDVHWWGSYALDVALELPEDDFRLQLFADVGGAPEINPFYSVGLGEVDRVDTGDTDAAGNPIYEYWVDLADPITLSAGVTYHLSIANDTSESIATWLWAATTETERLGYHLRADDDMLWLPQMVPPNLAFNLTGEPLNGGAPIPEPATVSLLGLGVAGLVARYRGKPNRRS